SPGGASARRRRSTDTPLDRNLGSDPRAATRRALDHERPAERLDAVGQPAKAAAARKVGPTDAVVGDIDADDAVARGDGDGGVRGGGVLRYVRQRLRADEVQ